MNPQKTRIPGGFFTPHHRTLCLTLMAMLAFAGNSLLCRLALRHTAIDAASFTAIRIISGAAALCLIVLLRDRTARPEGNWPSAFALFMYAAAFSFAYTSLPAGAGALILFGAVQATMIGYGVWTGERLRWRQLVGLILACSGLAGLLLPGLSAPPLYGSLLMLAAGLAWGVYSLRGKAAGNPTLATTGNFLRASFFAALLGVAMLSSLSLDGPGVLYAVLSGALASGLGYAIWYRALRDLEATSAATVQLSVPVLAALGGVAFLDEAITWQLLISSVAIFAGVVLTMTRKPPKN